MMYNKEVSVHEYNDSSNKLIPTFEEHKNNEKRSEIKDTLKYKFRKEYKPVIPIYSEY